MKDLLREYRFHLDRMLDMATMIGASKEQICNDVVLMMAHRAVPGFRDIRIRRGGGTLQNGKSQTNEKGI
ncbi:MAG: hypothetical protein IJL31_00205 [Oscillospiraceae bacterium]|nr:hypothetical protein [Oscillospiraceae bacterium]MBQ6243222.1 hypothetical protein [Bacteroidales bacterium]